MKWQNKHDGVIFQWMFWLACWSSSSPWADTPWNPNKYKTSIQYASNTSVYLLCVPDEIVGDEETEASLGVLGSTYILLGLYKSDKSSLLINFMKGMIWDSLGGIITCSTSWRLRVRRLARRQARSRAPISSSWIAAGTRGLGNRKSRYGKYIPGGVCNSYWVVSRDT